jgi:hypothetical protein
MNKWKKSRKLLFIATALTIVVLALVLSVYAAVLLGTFQGGKVIVGGVGSSSVTYSTTNATDGTWTSTLTAGTVSSDWYSRLEISESNTYSGPVTITWQLQIESSPDTWTNVGSTVTTTVTLTTGAQDVYASTNGLITGNTDWGSSITSAGTYAITATVDSV